jgi:hypothetical protein
VIVVGGKIRDDVDGVAKRRGCSVVGVAADFEFAQQRRSRISVVRVRDVSEIATGAFQEIGMQREPENTLMPALSRVVAVIDRQGWCYCAGGRIHANDATPCPFGHPQLIIGPNDDFPGHAEPARHHTEREGRLRRNRLQHHLRERHDEGEFPNHQC